MRIRAALALGREEFAATLGVHLRTLDRWERAELDCACAKGLPADMLTALRDRILREGALPEESRKIGNLVSQALLREGSLSAFAQLLWWAGRRRRMFPWPT
jgi:hypothetical protein